MSWENPDGNGHYWVSSGPEDDSPWCAGCNEPADDAYGQPCSEPERSADAFARRPR